MTCILADASMGIMCADSNMTDSDRVWRERKVYRLRGALVGTAGDVIAGEAFRHWWSKDWQSPPDFDFSESSALVLDDSGLYVFDASTLGLRKVDSGREAIGSGGKVAIAVYDALGWKEPAKSVRIACRYDAGCRTPVRTYKL